jgi:hypothetical protein
LSAGSHSFEIVAANAKGSTRYSGGLTVAPTVPTISKVKTKATTSDKAATIAWNVADIDGIANVALSIDGGEPIAMSQKAGAKSSNYSYSAKLTAGTHSYTITALDSAGAAAASSTGTLTVKGTTPAIKNVKATAKTSGDTTTITWTVYDIDGIGSTTLKIDGSAVAAGITQVANADGSVTYTYMGLQSAGKHTFTVGAIDAAPSPVSAKQAKGSFTVKPTAPTVSNIVTAGTTDDAAIAWTVYDVDGIGSVSLTIDGKAVNSSLITVSVKSNAEASYSYAGSLAAGEHTYLITVTDAKKVSGKATARFVVVAVSTSVSCDGTWTWITPTSTEDTGCWTTGSISFLDTVSVFVPEATVIDQE